MKCGANALSATIVGNLREPSGEYRVRPFAIGARGTTYCGRSQGCCIGFEASASRVCEEAHNSAAAISDAVLANSWISAATSPLLSPSILLNIHGVKILPCSTAPPCSTPKGWWRRWRSGANAALATPVLLHLVEVAQRKEAVAFSTLDTPKVRHLCGAETKVVQNSAMICPWNGASGRHELAFFAATI